MLAHKPSFCYFLIKKLQIIIYAWATSSKLLFAWATRTSSILFFKRKENMQNNVKDTINAKGIEIRLYPSEHNDEYISLTDIARYRSDDPNYTIRHWMRSKETLAFLGLWEKLHNPTFKPTEFGRFKNEAGYNAFTMSPQKWIHGVNAVGIISKSGRYDGGTYAHPDIAFEFASWISAEFKLYIVKDYQRLKRRESSYSSIDWNIGRTIAKINYKIQTDAIKDSLIPPSLTPNQIAYTYADEADLLNVALFGMTAKEWQEKNEEKTGNMRDYANINQLLILANLESYNAILISRHVSQAKRLPLLREMVTRQLKALANVSMKELPTDATDI